MKQFLPRFQNCIIGGNSTLKDALKAITESGALMACVTDKSRKLLGILTDSDIRKALLLGAKIEDSIGPWTNASPIFASHSLGEDELRNLSVAEGIREIPLVDSRGNLVDIFVAVIHDHRVDIDHDREQGKSGHPNESLRQPNSMLLLAGGKGTRLRSIVNDRPKPLAEVGGRPILETVITNAAAQGISRFYVAVNYMADKIIEHLRASSYKGLEIEVLREEEFLGTAGCVGMLPKDLREPFIVANADVLTNVNYLSLLDHHRRESATLTCVVRSHQMTVPFGVVQVQDGQITEIIEKPNVTNLVNTGIYVLNPDVVHEVESNSYLDMPVLIQKLASKGRKISPFFMHEYWMDIGRPDDFHQANQEYSEHFGSKLHDI